MLNALLNNTEERKEGQKDNLIFWISVALIVTYSVVIVEGIQLGTGAGWLAETKKPNMIYTSADTHE